MENSSNEITTKKTTSLAGNIYSTYGVFWFFFFKSGLKECPFTVNHLENTEKFQEENRNHGCSEHPEMGSLQVFVYFLQAFSLCAYICGSLMVKV